MHSDVNLLSLMMVFACHLFGSYAHWRKLKWNNRSQRRFYIAYLFADYPGRSMSVLTVLALASWTSCVGGMGDNLNPLVLYATIKANWILTWASASALTSAIGSGYFVDSAAGKDTGPPKIEEMKP